MGAAYGLDDGTQNVVMRQFDLAVRNLEPADARHSLGFDPARRAFHCPKCLDQANRDWQDESPRLAQFRERRPRSTELRCSLYRESAVVRRERCAEADCPEDVIHAKSCLTCLQTQDESYLFVDALADGGLADDLRYRFEYARGEPGRVGETTTDERKVPGDEAAREFGRRAMASPILIGWDTLTIEHAGPRGTPLRSPSPLAWEGQVLGTWKRKGQELAWRDGARPGPDDPHP